MPIHHGHYSRQPLSWCSLRRNNSYMSITRDFDNGYTAIIRDPICSTTTGIQQLYETPSAARQRVYSNYTTPLLPSVASQMESPRATLIFAHSRVITAAIGAPASWIEICAPMQPVTVMVTQSAMQSTHSATSLSGSMHIARMSQMQERSWRKLENWIICQSTGSGRSWSASIIKMRVMLMERIGQHMPSRQRHATFPLSPHWPGPIPQQPGI